jgi:hypothetical protein
MIWAVWLGAPVAITAVAAVGTWWRNRPRPPQPSETTVDRHRDFLAALADATGPPLPPDGPGRLNRTG